MSEEFASRLVRLFSGNERSSGRYAPATERMWVEYEPLADDVMVRHLRGEEGCGSVPITDDDKCTWAAIDMDNHGSDEDLPIHDIDRKCRSLGLPLITCRSKSGGVHAYLFLTDKTPASKVRTLMTKWAEELGYGGSEVFPKQSRLTESKGKKQYGNWINLPYFANETTMRYAIHDGKKLLLEEFLDLAEEMRMSPSALKSMARGLDPDAPPCIQAIMADGVEKGQRNEAMFNVVVYFRKRDPDSAERMAEQVNQTIFTTPLGRSEMQRTVASALKPEYSYRCGEDVLRSNCDRAACLRRRYGITQDEASSSDSTNDLPIFTDLVKYITEPVRWELTVAGVRLFNISTPQLLEWRAIREMIADRLTLIVPMIKPNEWERILNPLMQNARLIETPDDASINGVIRDRLREFCSKADMADHGDDPESRKALLRGMPVVQRMDGDRCVVFRAQDFISYLKRTKSEELKGVNLWFAVQDLGVMHKKMRVTGKDSCNVWYLPVNVVVRDLAAEPVDFSPEL